MQTLLSLPNHLAGGERTAAHVVFSGGGTAGHLLPGVAVAEQLRRLLPGVRITFAGAGRASERRIVDEAGFAYLALPCRPRPRSAWGTLRFVTDHWAGYRKALRVLRREQVGVVVGLGSYGSVPAARAAAKRGVPLVLLEQNAVAGRATRWMAPAASLICAAWPQSRIDLRTAGPLRVTGTPIRESFAAARVARAQRLAGGAAARSVLVLGGSQGARSLNQFAPRALYRAGAAKRGWTVVHQCGEEDLAATRALYTKLGIKARVAPYFEAIADELVRADLVVSRAGGSTLAEMAAVGVPSILVPYPHATDDHQRANAEVFVDAGAARMVDAREVSGRLDARLATELTELLGEGSPLAAMGAAAEGLSRPDAAWHIAQMVADLLPVRQTRKAAG